MDIQINTAALVDLESRLRTVGRSLDRRTLSPALMDAAKPALDAVKGEAPRGKGYQRVSLSHKRGRKNDYRRGGGATAQDTRLKAVDGVGAEVVRVLVGVSKKSGKVGWRTHFITFGTVKNRRANPFIDRGVNRTLPIVIARFMGSLQKTVDKIINRG